MNCVGHTINNCDTAERQRQHRQWQWQRQQIVPDAQKHAISFYATFSFCCAIGRGANSCLKCPKPHPLSCACCKNYYIFRRCEKLLPSTEPRPSSGEEAGGVCVYLCGSRCCQEEHSSDYTVVVGVVGCSHHTPLCILNLHLVCCIVPSWIKWPFMLAVYCLPLSNPCNVPPTRQCFWFQPVYDMLFAFVAISRRSHTHTYTHSPSALPEYESTTQKPQVSLALNHIYCIRAPVAMQLMPVFCIRSILSAQPNASAVHFATVFRLPYRHTNLYLKIMFFDCDYVPVPLPLPTPVYSNMNASCTGNAFGLTQHIFDFPHSNTISAMEWSTHTVNLLPSAKN